MYRLFQLRVLAWLTLLGLLLVPALPSAAAEDPAACGTGAPAVPLPRTRTIGGQTVALWPPNGFQPADSGRPLPAERDSTGFQGLPTQVTGARSGLELFTDVDVAGNHAYVAYNVGFSIWDLGGASSAARPRQRSARDGFFGHFCSFEEIGEVDEIIWDIAYAGDGANEMVALAGIGFKTGLTLWNVSDKSAPVQLYQDTTRNGRRVEAVRFKDQAYAFFGTTESATSGGLHVYNLSAAAKCRAAESNNCASGCPGVYLGEIADWREVQYLSVLKRTIGAAERLFVAVSDGTRRPRGVEIHEITDLRGGKLASRQVFSGLHERARGLALFNYRTKAYLAVKDHDVLKIFDVTACLDGNNCSALRNNAPVWSENIGLVGTNEELVTFTEADAGHPFLFFGNDTVCQRGAKKERLLDLRNLGAVSPVLPELTDGGGTYADPAHGQPVDYWGSYYDLNTHGFSYVAPRVVRVRYEPGNDMFYFYRTAWSIFDVHQLSLPRDEIFKDGFESGNTSAWSRRIGLRGAPTALGEGSNAMKPQSWTPPSTRTASGANR